MSKRQQGQGPVESELLSLVKQGLQQEGEEELAFRRVWDAEEMEWYYSITDFIKYVTNAVNSTTYWANFKRRKAKDEDLSAINLCKNHFWMSYSLAHPKIIWKEKFCFSFLIP